LADETAAGFFGIFLFPSVLHQDPRYYRLGAGSFKKRLVFADDELLSPLPVPRITEPSLRCAPADRKSGVGFAKRQCSTDELAVCRSRRAAACIRLRAWL
jgi:hypothetical protein